MLGWFGKEVVVGFLDCFLTLEGLDVEGGYVGSCVNCVFVDSADSALYVLEEGARVSPEFVDLFQKEQHQLFRRDIHAPNNSWFVVYY